MVVQTDQARRLHDVFRFADIDDITLEPFADFSEQVELVFTERVTGESHQVAAQDLDTALDQASVILNENRAIRELRSTGLSGSDIADLTNRPDLRDLDEEYDRTPEGEAWARGFNAGVEEAGELYAAALGSRLSSLPAQAAVGEPVEGPTVDREGGIRIIPIDIPAYLALVMPTPVVHD